MFGTFAVGKTVITKVMGLTLGELTGTVYLF